MIYLPQMIRSDVSIQPVLNLIEIFQETTAYERSWSLPFNSLALCAKENPSDPSWCELTEKKLRFNYEADTVTFTTCHTPMRIRYTTENLHYCIHFRYELFPGVDLFSGIKERYILDDEIITQKIKSVFTESDPMRKIAIAESAAIDSVLKLWPEKLPLDIEEMSSFSALLEYVKANLNSQFSVSDMSSFMGWSEGYFYRIFHKVFHITPKQYLLRELFAKAAALLNDPQKSIKEIAGELNFSTEFNFSRFIKHYSGYYPSELRKNVNGPLYIRK